jgi:aldehyde dehydrogenase (NAD+)
MAFRSFLRSMHITEELMPGLLALRAHHAAGALREIKERRRALKSLRTALRRHEEALLSALHADMRKPRFEGYLADVALVHSELDHVLRHLEDWTRVQHPPTPLSLQPARSTLLLEPLGVVLIIAPWNYPAQLVLNPLIAALAAGNCAVVKPSNETPHTAAVVERILAEALPREVLVVQGPGMLVGERLITPFRFDHIFFTGSPAVGRRIMALAAPHLTPVTLELGGKSPAIVDRRVDVERAADRIAWGKFFNAGQTCIAPDHVLVHTAVQERFLEALKRAVLRYYGTDPQQSPHYARLVNDKRFGIVQRYLGEGTALVGGASDAGDRYIAPTVLTHVPSDAACMQEEIFGPVLPVLPWTGREEVLAQVARNPHPLAAYIFSSDRVAQRYFSRQIAFGGGCINHCMLHFGHPEMPFGGVGTSGMGRYHGRQGVLLFSNHKNLVQASTLIEHGLQQPPYSTWKERVLRWVVG